MEGITWLPVSQHSPMRMQDSAHLVAGGKDVAVGVPRGREAIVEVSLERRHRLPRRPVHQQALRAVANGDSETGAARLHHGKIDRPGTLHPAAEAGHEM